MPHASWFMPGGARPTHGRAVAAALTTMLLGTVVVAQQPPTFKAGTTLVDVSAIVTRDGVPVGGLGQDDFRVLDNGVEQSLVAFEYVALTAVGGPDQGRDFVLVIDDWHIFPNWTPQVRDVAQAFARALGPHDRLALVTTGPHQVAVDLTTDRTAIDAAIARLHGQQPTGPPAPFETELRARGAFDVIRQVADSLKGDAAERRTIVLVSEGHQLLTDGVARLGDDPAVLAMYMDVVRDAALANVAIYAIDPRGLMAPSPGFVGGGPHMSMSMAAHASANSAQAMARRRFGSLGTMALHTGGTLTVDTNDLTADIPQIIRDSRQYYRLAYVQPEPAPGKRQPSSRRIEVKVKSRGLEVRARQRYVPTTAG